MNALKFASEAQKQQMAAMNMDQIEDLYDDLADMMADNQEINDVLGRDYGVDNYDENDLMNGTFVT